MARTLLAVGAHYDDCVFGIPGVLLQAVRKHYRVVIVAVIGDYTNWKPVGKRRNDALISGTKQICAEYGAELRYLDYASMHIPQDDEAKRKLSEIVADVQPEIAFTLWPSDTHPDHVAAAALAKTALRWSGTVLGKNVARPRRIYQFDNGPRHTIGFEPDTYVDVSPEWPASIDWLGRFMALVRDEPYDPSRRDGAQQSKEALALYRGRACGAKYAEAFKSFEPYPQEILEG